MKMISKSSIVLGAVLAAVTTVIVVIYVQSMSDWSAKEKEAAERIEKAKARQASPTIATVDESEQQGMISGKLTYPSEGIPDSMAAHAINIDTYKVYSTDKHIVLDSTTPWGTYGYQLTVPVGTYYVFGTTTKDFTSDNYRASYAFYNEFMKCFDAVPDCEKNRTKTKIKVGSSESVDNITVGDWWLSRCRPRDDKVTIDWLLRPVCGEPLN